MFKISGVLNLAMFYRRLPFSLPLTTEIVYSPMAQKWTSNCIPKPHANKVLLVALHISKRFLIR